MNHLYTVVPFKADGPEVRWLSSALKFAQSASPDTSTKNGAVLVTLNGIPVHACNGVPNQCCQRVQGYATTVHKHDYIQHAENGAIFAAARLGRPTIQSTLYCPWYACNMCAVAIAAAGVRRVVGVKSLMDATPKRWRVPVERGFEILHSAGVQTDVIDHKFELPLRFNRRDIIV